MGLMFDPFDEATRRDPYDLFTRARREHPVWRHAGLPVVSVFRWDDVHAILRDSSTFSSVFPPPPGFAESDQLPSMLGSDPPVHTRLRGLVNQAFTPRRVRALAPRIAAIADSLLDDAFTRGTTVDLVDGLAYPLPVIVIAEMLGVPASDRAAFKSWSDDLVRDLGAAFFAAPTQEAIARQRRTRVALTDYFRGLIDRRRTHPEDDLLTGLVQAEVEGARLSFDELMGMLVLLLVAGNETTTNLIGNAVVELCAHPATLAALRADPGLTPAVVQEVLRYASPVQMDVRRATSDVDLRGTRVVAGEFVLEWLGSANRDEDVFERAEAFDPTRSDQRHVGFGFGIHYCLGASLATLEAEIALERLIARTRRFARVDDAPLPLHPSIVFRGVRALPMHVEPAA